MAREFGGEVFGSLGQEGLCNPRRILLIGYENTTEIVMPNIDVANVILFLNHASLTPICFLANKFCGEIHKFLDTGSMEIAEGGQIVSSMKQLALIVSFIENLQREEPHWVG